MITLLTFPSALCLQKHPPFSHWFTGASLLVGWLVWPLLDWLAGILRLPIGCRALFLRVGQLIPSLPDWLALSRFVSIEKCLLIVWFV
jgi:hypothetical protein